VKRQKREETDEEFCGRFLRALGEFGRGERGERGERGSDGVVYGGYVGGELAGVYNTGNVILAAHAHFSRIDPHYWCDAVRAVLDSKDEPASFSIWSLMRAVQLVWASDSLGHSIRIVELIQVNDK
jgi:hypothetical protein